MKFMLLIFFFALTVNVRSADWLELPVKDEGYQVFIDRDSIVSDKPFFEFWLKLEYKSLQKIPDSNMKFDKVLLHFLISCDDSAEALDKKKYFREGVLAKSIRTEQEELAWKTIEPDTTNAFLMNKFCANNSKQDQEQE